MPLLCPLTDVCASGLEARETHTAVLCLALSVGLCCLLYRNSPSGLRRFSCGWVCSGHEVRAWLQTHRSLCILVAESACMQWCYALRRPEIVYRALFAIVPVLQVGLL